MFRACCKYVNTEADPLPSLTLLLTSFITIVSSSVMSPSQVSMEARRGGKDFELNVHFEVFIQS